MPQSMPVFPDLPAVSYIITLDGARYRLRFTYRERTASWYLDVETQGGEPIATGRRMSGRFNPLDGVAAVERPPGAFLIRGNLATRDQLGTEDGLLIYFGEDEIPPEEEPDLGYTVFV